MKKKAEQVRNNDVLIMEKVFLIGFNNCKITKFVLSLRVVIHRISHTATFFTKTAF